MSPWTGETCLRYQIKVQFLCERFSSMGFLPQLFLLFSRTKVVSPYCPSVLPLQMTRRSSSPHLESLLSIVFYGSSSAENRAAPLPQQVFQCCLIYAVQQASSDTFESLRKQARESKWTCQLSRYEIDSVLAKGVAIRDQTRWRSETLIRPPKSEIHQATDD